MKLIISQVASDICLVILFILLIINTIFFIVNYEILSRDPQKTMRRVHA